MEFKYKVRRGVFYLAIVMLGIFVAGNIIGQAMDKNYSYNMNLVNEENT